MQPGFETVLEILARSAGVEHDPVHTREMAGQAYRELPGDLADVWPARLARAGKDLGLRISAPEMPLREALRLVSDGDVLVTHVPAPAGGWVVLEGYRRRKYKLSGMGQADEWLSQAQLVRRLGLSSSRQQMRWAMATPLSPCSEASPHGSHRRHDGAASGLGHGHSVEGFVTTYGHRHWAHDHTRALRPRQRLMQLLRPDLQDIRVIAMFAVAVGILNLATPLAVESLVMTVGFRMLQQQVLILSLLLFACLALAATMFTVQKIVVEYIQQRFYVRMVADLAYRLPRIETGSVLRGSGPELVNRFFDVMTVQKAISVLLVDGVALVLTTMIGLSVMAFYHPYLLGFDIVLLGAIGFFIFILGRGGIATAIEESIAKYRTEAWLEELALNPVAFKLGHGPDYALERADQLAKGWLKARRDHFRIVYRQVLFAVYLQVLASTVLLGLGGWLVIQGQLTLGQLVASELIVATIVGSFAKIGKYAENYYDLLAAVDKLGVLFDLPMEREGGEFLRGSDRGAALQMRDVTFAFDEHAPVLESLSLSVAPGERLALTGPSACGKSTVLELILDLRVPESGQLEFDGVDYRDIRIDALRSQVGAVLQPEVIEGTILENVRMGRHGIPISQVRRVLEAVGLWDEVSALPDSIYRPLSIGGAPLSHGQLYKLALARAIVGRPRMLLLDETLDALEPSDRHHLLEMLFDREAPWTLVVATHTPEVLERCDRIVTLSGHHPHDTPADRLPRQAGAPAHIGSREDA